MGKNHQDHGEATEGVDVLDTIFIHGIKGSLTLTLSKGRGNGERLTWNVERGNGAVQLTIDN